MGTLGSRRSKRSTAFGLLAAIGRVGAILGNTIFGLVIHSDIYLDTFLKYFRCLINVYSPLSLFLQLQGDNTAAPLVMTGVALIAGGALSMLLPNSSRMAID